MHLRPRCRRRKCNRSRTARSLLPQWCRHLGLFTNTLLCKPICSRLMRSRVWFHHLTLCENALAACLWGVVQPLHPLTGVVPCGCRISQVMPFLYEQSPHTAHFQPSHLRCDVSLLNGELARPISGVARVSRLIGNSDTTAKACHWQGGRQVAGDQVDAGGTGFAARGHRKSPQTAGAADPQKMPRRMKNATFSRVASLIPASWSLASQLCLVRMSLRYFDSGFPTGSFPCRAAHWR